jgi:hypothetical protein
LDFLVLRAASGEIEQEFADWWTEFLASDNAGREVLLAAKPLRTAKKSATVDNAKKTLVKKLTAVNTNEAAESDLNVPAPRKRRRRLRKPALPE